MINHVRVEIKLVFSSSNEAEDGDRQRNLLTHLDANSRKFTSLEFTPEGIVWKEDLGDKVGETKIAFTEEEMQTK